jgi:hypothetical protein
MTNLVALLIVTNLVRPHCEICDSTNAWRPAVLCVHQYERVVTTNYLPVVVDPRKEADE